MKRRKFLQMGLSLASMSLIEPLLSHLKAQNPKSYQDEAFWQPVRDAFSPSPDFINLENGYFSPMPNPVKKAWLENIEMINRDHTFYMRRKQFEDRENIRGLLAELAGVSSQEIALLRNTTEALNILISGTELKRGDEVILTNQDYPNMVEALQMRAKRDGIILKYIDLPKTDEQVLQSFQKSITPRTRAMLVTHVINLTGQILPVKELCSLGRSKAIEVWVDGAHAFAHLDFKISDLPCDYYATSLHKWLFAPLGCGLLFVRKEKIPAIWPLFGDASTPNYDIRKFERNGTQPCSNHLAIKTAIEFHKGIGSKLKYDRLRYLCKYWTKKVEALPNVRFNSPALECAIANVAHSRYSPDQLSAYLFDKHKIFTVAIDTPAVKGVRVTPHLYNTLEDLDTLVEALKEA